MAIIVDTATFTIQDTTTTVDLTGLTIPANTNRGIAVVISQRGSNSDWVTSVTWDFGGAGEALTQRVNVAGTTHRVYAYSLTQPTAGASKTLRIATSNANAFWFVTVILFHADDPISYDTGGTAAGTDNNPTDDITPTAQPALILASATSEANSVGTGVGAWADATVNNSDEGSWIAMSGYAVKTSTAAVTTDFNTTQLDEWTLVNMSMIAPAAASSSFIFIDHVRRNTLIRM